MFNHHPHSRYQLLEKPMAYPGTDIIHRTPDGPVFDLGVESEVPGTNGAFGNAYLQVADVLEMAHVLGMATHDEVAAKDKRIAELEAQLLKLPNETETLKDGLDDLVRDFLARISTSDPVVPVEVDTEKLESESGKSERTSNVSDKPKRNAKGSDRNDDKNDGQGDGPSVNEGTNGVSGSSKYDALELTGFDFD
jgi:hypothetical protein